MKCILFNEIDFIFKNWFRLVHQIVFVIMSSSGTHHCIMNIHVVASCFLQTTNFCHIIFPSGGESSPWQLFQERYSPLE